MDLSDLLGPAPAFDDILGPPSKKRRTRHARIKRRTWGTKEPYKPLEQPETPVDGGIWDLRQKAHVAGTLGKKCLICKAKLKRHNEGRAPVICPGSRDCYRGYRNAYRKEYDRAHPGVA